MRFKSATPAAAVAANRTRLRILYAAQYELRVF